MGVVVGKWEAVNLQVVQEFEQVRQALVQKEKESIETLNLMKKQELGILQEIDSLYSFCRKTLEAYTALEPSNQQIRRLGRLKKALVAEQIKKGEKRKILLDGYEYKKTKPNL